MLITQLFINPIGFFVTAFFLIFILCLHELAHGFAAISQGDDTPKKKGHMTLNPFVHIRSMGWGSFIFLCLTGIGWGQMPVDPSKFRSGKWGKILVFAAGPLLNLALGILFTTLIRPSMGMVLGVLSEFYWTAARLNFMWFIFNMLPIPPLDGFDILSEIFPAIKLPKDNKIWLMALIALCLIPGFWWCLDIISQLMIAVSSWLYSNNMFIEKTFIAEIFIAPINFLRRIFILIFAVSLHGLARGLAAISQGDDTPKKTGHMTLNPFVHIRSMGWESIIFLCLTGIGWGQMPVKPYKFRSGKWGKILVFAAGPLLNLALGILFTTLIRPTRGIGLHSLSEFFLIAAYINFKLFVFNMLPIFPLDGFHIFREIFPAIKLPKDKIIGLMTLMALSIIPGFWWCLYAIPNKMVFGM